MDNEQRKREQEFNRAARKAAKAVLISWQPTLVTLGLPEAFITAFNTLFAPLPRGAGRGKGKSTINSRLAAFFCEKKFVNELELFQAFKIGRGEMRKKARELVKTASPDDRVWVWFNEESERWEFKGDGANEPIGWQGFKPLDGGSGG